MLHFNLIYICFMRHAAKQKLIDEVVVLQLGYPFRGSIQATPAGTVRVVQMRDTDPETGVNWSDTVRTELPGRKQADWLREGDILFASRGSRFYAVCLGMPPLSAVCSPQFFHLRVNPGGGVLPAFLAWQINQPPFQRQLLQAAEGSNQLSIRMSVFAGLTINVPSLADQRRVAALADMARQERSALRRLIRTREQQLESIAEHLAIAPRTTTEIQ
ncbi:restriction endonuclease subunit S [Variovorax rhizosphaerae]|uniref:Restriction endonuclease subunit S n=1 Tax=Variovorax rhizosphaerae TaxID=1836200 RepID=A0ABU8WEA1_9BURK